MKTKQDVLDFIKSELECNNTLVIATLGNGGAGLSHIQTQDEDEISAFIGELNSYEFNGKVDASADIKSSEFYSDGFEVYQFVDNGLQTQIMVY